MRRIDLQTRCLYFNRCISVMRVAQRFGGITDGLSNTLCASETIQGKWSGPFNTSTYPWDIRGWTHWGPSTQFTTHLTPNSRQPDVMDTPQFYCNNLFNPRHPCTGNSTAWPGWTLAARSDHPGGVNAVLLDGSVRFYSNTVDVRAWQSLGSTHGGEVTSGDL